MAEQTPNALGVGSTALLGRKLFSFSSFQDWVNRASRMWKLHEVSSRYTVCVDQKGRICGWGEHFMAAREDGSFPVDVHYMRPDMPPNDKSGNAPAGGES